MSENGLGSLFTKLAKISGELGSIAKDAKHQQGYMYQSADSVMAHLNPLLAHYSIVIIPMATRTRLETPSDGVSRYVIDYEFVICDGDTGATFTAAWQGDVPTGYAGGKIDDKAMGKAHTYALKYWLLKLFKVTSQDDVDLDRNNTTYSNQPPAKAKKADKPSNVTDIPTQSTASGNGYQYGKSTLQVFTKANTDGSKRYMTVSGVSIWTRKPFEALGFNEQMIEQLGELGEHILPHAVTPIFEIDPKTKYKKLVQLRRDDTGEIVDADGNPVETQAAANQ